VPAQGGALWPGRAGALGVRSCRRHVRADSRSALSAADAGSRGEGAVPGRCCHGSGRLRAGAEGHRQRGPRRGTSGFWCGGDRGGSPERAGLPRGGVRRSIPLGSRGAGEPHRVLVPHPGPWLSHADRWRRSTGARAGLRGRLPVLSFLGSRRGGWRCGKDLEEPSTVRQCIVADLGPARRRRELVSQRAKRWELLFSGLTARSVLPIAGEKLSQSTDFYLDVGPSLTFTSAEPTPAFGGFVSFAMATRLFP
jgi:hypothetical protein